MNFFKSNTFYFLLFVFANLLLKLLFIDYYSLSYDEMISVKNTQLPFGHIKHEAEWDNNPPFYYYCLWVWSAMFGIGEFVLRLLSAIFISLAIGLNFLLMKKQFNYSTAIVSSLFLSLSSFLMFYAHEARTYSLVLLLAMVSTMLFFNFLKQPNYLNLFFLALTNFLLVYSHYLAALIIVAQYIFILLFERKHWLKLLLYHSVFIAALVFLRFTEKQFANIFGFNSKGDFWLQTATINDLKNTVTELFFDWRFFIVALIVAFIVFVIYKRNIATEQKRFLIYCLLVGFFSFAFLFTIGIFKAVFLSRYLIFTLPFVIAFFVFLITQIPRAGIILSVALLIFPAYTFTFKPLKGQDYRAVSEIIKKDYSDETCVLINTFDNTNLFLYYFNRAAFELKDKRDSVLFSNRIFGVNDTNEVNKLDIMKYKTVYLVQSYNKKVKGEDIMQSYLKCRYEYFTTQQFIGTEFSVAKNLKSE